MKIEQESTHYIKNGNVYRLVTIGENGEWYVYKKHLNEKDALRLIVKVENKKHINPIYWDEIG